MTSGETETPLVRVQTQLHRCPYCRDAVAEDDAQYVCKRCLARHHPECWRELGHCSVHGCACDEYLDSGLSSSGSALTTPGEAALVVEPTPSEGETSEWTDSEAEQRLAEHVRAVTREEKRKKRASWTALLLIASLICFVSSIGNLWMLVPATICAVPAVALLWRGPDPS